MSLSLRRLCLLGICALLAVFAPAARFALANSYAVSNLNDSGAGSLRDAINQANASVGTNDTITFTIAGIINLASTLPALTDPAGVTIDASSNSVPKVPTVELRGYNSTTQVAQDGPGIEIASSNNIVRGLAINGFQSSAIRAAELTGAGIIVNGHASATPLTNNLIEYNYIGTDLSGNAAAPGGGFNNAEAGIALEFGAQGTTIQHNVISGNYGQGIYLYSSVSSGKFQQNNTILDNKIGVNPAGTQALPNGSSGIFVADNSNITVIGPGNVISGNGGRGNPRSYGVLIAGNTTGGGVISGNVVKGNRIGTNAAGTAAIANTNDGAVGGGVGIGIVQASAQGTIVGGATEADGNLISGNQLDGIAITSGSSAGTTTSNTIVQNNTIGLAANGVTPLANTRAGINLQGGTQNNTISANKVSGNSTNGIEVSGVGTTGNRITQTTTSANGGKGIALSGGGNLGDQANRPGLSGVTFAGTPPTLSGTVTNAASCGDPCWVEVFGADTSLVTDAEGPVYLHGFPVKINAASFSNISLPVCKPFLIFTVTDTSGNTSEFINPIGPVPTDCPAAVPVVQLSDATPSPNQNALPGDIKVFTHTVANIGTAAGALTITPSSSNGWTTTLDKSACPATLAPSQSCQITLSVTVPGDAQSGQSNSTTITAAL